MSDLHARIYGLDRVTAYEAAQLLAVELGADPDVKPLDHEMLSNPVIHQDDLEDLAKVLLLTTTEADPEAVTRAIDGAGHKQLVLGGGELIALVILVVNGLQILISKGRTSEEVEMVVQRDSNGQEQVTTTRKTIRYGVSAGLAGLLGNLLKGSSQALEQVDPPNADGLR